MQSHFSVQLPLRDVPRVQSAPKPYQPWRALVPEWDKRANEQAMKFLP